MRHSYHFCVRSPKSTVHVDGIVDTKDKVLTKDGYDSFKRDLAEDFTKATGENITGPTLVLLSMSYLGEVA